MSGAVVVGGASGIGAAVVAQQQALGLEVVVWDVAGSFDVECDVSDPAQVDAAVSATLDRVGIPGIVSVCAGIGHSGMLLDTDPAEFDRVMGVNAKGAWLAMRGMARAMLDAGTAGSIVATTSVSARLVDRNMGLYCASKAALEMLVKVAAAEWGEHGIRVNAVAPGVTSTPMLRAPLDSPWLRSVAEHTALGHIGDADAVAGAIVAVHDLSWVTGQVLAADGGLSLQSPIDSYGAHRIRSR